MLAINRTGSVPALVPTERYAVSFVSASCVLSPNPSIEETSTSKLRLLVDVPHVKR